MSKSSSDANEPALPSAPAQQGEVDDDRVVDRLEAFALQFRHELDRTGGSRSTTLTKAPLSRPGDGHMTHKRPRITAPAVAALAIATGCGGESGPKNNTKTAINACFQKTGAVGKFDELI